MTSSKVRNHRDVTELLRAAASGDTSAVDRLFPLVYDELRRRARAQLRKGWPEAPETTALVHEAYMKLAGSPIGGLESRAHFFAVAARAMRQILVDLARRHRAEKRGGNWNRTTLSDRIPALTSRADELLALDQALRRLEAFDPRLGRVVEFRFFAGMTEEEIAGVFGVSAKTVQRDWVKARAWLYRELDAPVPGGTGPNSLSDDDS
jgi:RNA polymerase sigma factor (TIGR02999 family)